jgi:hypothetical protein
MKKGGIFGGILKHFIQTLLNLDFTVLEPRNVATLES